MSACFKSTTVLLLFCLIFSVPAVRAEEEAPQKRSPKVWLSPEIGIEGAPDPTPVKITAQKPTDPGKEKPGWFSRNKWWVLLGTVVVGGAAAALASGGGGGGGDNGGADSTQGTYTSTWGE